ncbi:MAG: hypothetical protein MI861_01230 [Pirellulales bacterium]|nr:hypothetical protein [Pirellulales bacterium]
MGLIVQRESLDSAREDAIATLKATRSIPVDEYRYRWLYQSNPDGQAVLWAVRDQDSGAMAGFTVCLPRRMTLDGRQVTAWNGADFSILPKFRTLGVALKLRRAAKLEIDDGAAELLYSHPNEKMQVIHEKVGHFCVGRMERYSKPLRLGQKLAPRMPGWAATAVDATLGRVVTTSVPELVHRYQHEVKFAPSLQFNDDYDHLFADTCHQRGLVGVRDQRYLDWRYRQYPDQKFQLIEAFRNGRLAGFLIFLPKQESYLIQDVFGSDPHTKLDLIVHAVRTARAAGAQSISMTLLEQSELISILQRVGFRLRPDHSHMFTYAANDQLQPQIADPKQWLIHVGDRDV